MSNPTPISIGMDVGHSSVKTVVKAHGGQVLAESNDLFPTVVRNWTAIANEETAKKAEEDTVEIEGQKFFVGITAARQGQAENFTGQSRNWTESIQHDALVLAAWSRAMKILAKNNIHEPSNIALTVGLPSSYYKEQRGSLRARISQLIRKNITPHQNLSVYVESQSRAPLMCVAFDNNGNETGRAGDDESWGVVEIGHFTTDFTFHDRGQEVDSAASSSPGVHVVYDRIGTVFKQHGYLSDFDNISTAIKTTKIKRFGEMVDVSDIISPIIREFSHQILEEVTTRFGEKAQRMDGIIVAGGGSYIVGSDIKAKFKNAIVPPNARMTVAEGYARFGLVTLG